MVKVVVCIGSACHVKGSKQVIESLQYLIREKELGDQIDLAGTFCTGNCKKGVCVTVNDKLYSVSPETTEKFFKTTVLDAVKKDKPAKHPVPKKVK